MVGVWSMREEEVVTRREAGKRNSGSGTVRTLVNKPTLLIAVMAINLMIRCSIKIIVTAM